MKINKLSVISKKIIGIFGIVFFLIVFVIPFLTINKIEAADVVPIGSVINPSTYTPTTQQTGSIFSGNTLLPAKSDPTINSTQNNFNTINNSVGGSSGSINVVNTAVSAPADTATINAVNAANQAQSQFYTNSNTNTGGKISYIPLETVNLPGGGSLGSGDITTYLANLFTFGIGIAGVLAVLMIVWGGVERLLSDSVFSKGEAKTRIQNAIWGLLLALMSYLILQTINPCLVKFSFFGAGCTVSSQGVSDYSTNNSVAGTSSNGGQNYDVFNSIPSVPIYSVGQNSNSSSGSNSNSPTYTNVYTNLNPNYTYQNGSHINTYNPYGCGSNGTNSVYTSTQVSQDSGNYSGTYGPYNSGYNNAPYTVTNSTSYNLNYGKDIVYGSGNCSNSSNWSGLVSSNTVILSPLRLLNFETGNLNQWDKVFASHDYSITLVTDPVRQGKYSARFEVRPGDTVAGFAGESSLLSLSSSPEQVGQDSWTAWSTFFPSDFVSHQVSRTSNTSSDYNLFVSWKSTASTTRADNAGINFGVDNTSGTQNIYMKVSGGDPNNPTMKKFILGPLVVNQWYDFVFDVKWSSDPNVGYVQVWINGVNVVSKTYLATLYNNQSVYLTQGWQWDTSSVLGTTDKTVIYQDSMIKCTDLQSCAAYLAK